MELDPPRRRPSPILSNDVLPKDNLLKGAENRETLARILDKADQAIRTWEIALTDFLSPPELLEAEAIFARLTEVNCLAWGGYPQAERQRLAIARADIPLDASQVGVTALAIAGNFLFDSASHRDFLGSLLGTGLVRDKVGDIVLLGDRGAQAIVVPELADFLTASLVQVRSVKVKTQIMPLEDLRVRPPKVKELTTVEASMRLDAIASAGFGMSRSKMVDLINAGDVRVNWKPVSQASHPIATNDLIAIRGKGRLTIGEVMITKKQRYRINLKRFI